MTDRPPNDPAGDRPFYAEYAWAYDLLNDRPAQKECAVIVQWLVERGVAPGSTLLDAGCGTGRYVSELARRGYVVEGRDRSPQLLAEAVRGAHDAGRVVTFTQGDILDLPPSRYDAILCRGVLNDFVDGNARRAVFTVFGGALRAGGVLVADVREWTATAERKRREPVFRKSIDTLRGRLTFTSITTLDETRRRLLVAERHALDRDGTTRAADYQFVMQCWTREEVHSALNLAGFGPVAFFGAYDAGVAAGSTDRLVFVARLV